MPSSGADNLATRVALDTSAYSQARRGHAATLDVISRAEIVHVSTTVLGELEAGFRAGGRYLENQRALTEFLSEPFVVVVDVTTHVSRRYGEIFAALKRAGTPIPVNDIWIASSTFTSGSHLITFDEDFSKVEGLAHTVLSS